MTDMLAVLADARRSFPMRLHTSRSNVSEWNSLFVDYEKPYVERLWQNFGDGFRIYMHKIHPCQPHETFFHRHPWPSAIYVEEGVYEMLVGTGTGDQPPETGVRIILPAGSSYEMVRPNDWHSVRPHKEASYSTFVTARPFPSWKQTPIPQQRELTPGEAEALYRKWVYEFYKN